MDIAKEKQIIEKAKSDPEAFGRLFDKFYRPIFNYTLRRTSDIEAAKDITSLTFFKALKNLGKFRWQNVSFSAWLYRIATNEINNFYRKKKNRIRVSLEKIPELQSGDSADGDYRLAEAELESKRDFKRLHEHIKKLRPAYQTVISLRFFEKKKISEICAITGKGQGTVKSRLHRALKELKGNMAAPAEAEQPFRQNGVILKSIEAKVWNEEI